MGVADSPLRDRVVFVTGAPRSGTSWLAGILAAHPEIAGTGSESHLFDIGVERLFANHEGAEGERHLAGFVAREQLVDLVRDLCDGVLAHMRERTKPGARFVMEKTPVGPVAPHDHVARKLECYPDAHWVHIVRDPDAVARSLERTPWAPGRPAQEWGRLAQASVAAIRDGLGALPRYVEVSYEELVARTGELSAELFGRLGLEWDDDVATRVEVVSRQRHAQWGEVVQPQAPAGGAGPRVRSGMARLRSALGRAARPAKGAAGGTWSKPGEAFIHAFSQRDEDALRALVVDDVELDLRTAEGDHRSSGEDARRALAGIATELFGAPFTSMTWTSSEDPRLDALFFSGLRNDAARVDLCIALMVEDDRVRRVALLTPGSLRGRHAPELAPGVNTGEAGTGASVHDPGGSR